jgi:PGF-CTERM protein
MVGVVGATQPTTADARAVDAAALGAAGAASLAHPANVSISNQISGGTTVVVDEVYVVDGGFVTVHDATVTKGGAETFSSVLGTSTYLESGVQENVTVTLDQPITNGSTLVAMLHRGTDGDRSYDFVSSNGQDDGPYVFTDEIVADTASVTGTATVDMTAQSSNGESVVVDRTELSQGGFVVVHDSTLLDGATFDSVRGVSGYLSVGLHENVVVTLDDTYTENGTAIPMPHRDTDGDQTYDFVTSGGADDGPHTNTREDSPAGAIVVAAAEVTVGMGDTDTATETMADDDQPTPDGSSDDGAGFGLVAALLAVVALALLARRG